MRILLVGSLSWNPERVLSLVERGHELWGVWTRSMAWDQGPYPVLGGDVRTIAAADAPRVIREEGIDVVYSLFQVYDRRIWAPARDGVEAGDAWTVLRFLLAERARGAFAAPIVRHWGFDVHNVDLEVAQALDGHLICNEEKHVFWRTPVAQGGAGIDVLGGCEVLTYLDGDRPKLEFATDRFSPRLSDGDGEPHTVCLGRPFGIDYVAAARAGIHVHVYGNSFDEAWRMIVRDLSPRVARRERALLRRYLHVHRSLQTVGASRADIWAAKTRWVEEFSRYDAGWSYLGRPLPWPDLDDRGAIPNRLSTYVLCGLPIVSDVRPGCVRYEEPRRLGIGIDLGPGGYPALRASLDEEIRTRARSERARAERAGYCFDASIDTLLATLERAREAYLAGPPVGRRAAPAGPPRLTSLATSPGIRGFLAGTRSRLREPGPLAWRVVLDEASEVVRRRTQPRQARRLERLLGEGP